MVVTIRDVAKRAGVAVSTVSKVINKYPSVSEDTIARVNKAIEELHFIPNSVAASLSSKQSGRVAVITDPDGQTLASSEIMMQYIMGAVKAGNEARIDVIPLFFSMLKDMTVEEIEHRLEVQNIRSIIMCGLDNDMEVLLDLVKREKFKNVLVDMPMVDENTSNIGVDHAQAQKDILRKTITENEGPSASVLYISGRTNSYVTEERVRGAKELAEELGYKLTIVDGAFSEKKAREITLEYGRNHDIIACGSDLMAIGAMKALTDMNIFHPVCGFDGITLMGYTGKNMNTVRQNFMEIGEEALREAYRLMTGETGRSIKVPYSLVHIRYEDVLA